MPITVADLVALEEKLQSERKRFLEDNDKSLAAVAHLKKNLKAEEYPEQSILNLANIERTPPTHPKLPEMSFAALVRNAASRFPEEVFSVGNIENVLQAQSAKLPPNNLRTRIAMEVKRMLKIGLVALVAKGRGTEPNKYRYIGEQKKTEGTSVNALDPSRLKLRLRSHAGTADAGGSVQQAPERR